MVITMSKFNVILIIIPKIDANSFSTHSRQEAGHLLLSVSVNPTHCVVASGKFPETFKATGFSIGPNEVDVFCWFYMLAQHIDRAGNGVDEEMSLVIFMGKGFLMSSWSDNENMGF